MKQVQASKVFLLAFVMAFIFATNLAHAQEIVTVGQDKVGGISAENPTPTYVFVAEANQQVTIRVSAVASPVLPQFTILNAGGILVQAVGNPNLNNSIEGVVTFAAAGSYSIQVSSADGSLGQFVLSVISSQPTVPPTPLNENEPVTGSLESQATLVYRFTGNPNQALLLALAGLDDQNVSAELTTAEGEVLATLSSFLLASDLNLPAGGDVYLLKLSNKLAGPVRFELSLTPQIPAADTTAATQVQLPTSGPCVLATRQAIEVNVRATPTSDGQILTTILPTETYAVIGRNSDSSWYQINYAGGSGWVSASVTRRGGDCSNVAVTAQVSPPPATGPTSTPTSQTGPTNTPTSQTGPTNTPTTETGPTNTPTTETGPTNTPTTEGQVAGDNEQSIQINIKNESRTVTGAISFPNGDTQDTVSYRVQGFDSITTSGNVVITAVCTGTGAENARVSFGGGGAGVPCNGATSTQFHTNDSNQGRVTVSLSAGEGAFVSWTLVFSANN